MSGIVGIVSLNGMPIDARLLRRMTVSLTDRGPDLQKTWVDGPVGFGHTLFSTVESELAQQPTTLDGLVWITADARVDGRADLVEKLCLRGRTNTQTASDAQLILHAYHAWGEDCVEHLLGDFAVAIWDGRRRRLFCARDHFGIKPLYYAEIHGGIVFSNTLDCVRLHPEVGGNLNELAIGDFLLFGYNDEPATTTFADVRRLPPAHSLTCEQGSLHHKRFWTLPTEGQIRYRRSNEYVEHFREVLRAAVSDRLRSSHAGVWMSGGLDSTSITAIARQLIDERCAPLTLRAHTIVYDTVIADQERRYSCIAAKALGVENDFFVADRYGPFDGWDQADRGTPEPTDDPFFFMRTEQLRQVASHSRVLLSGEGGDEVLWSSYVADLLGRMRAPELIAGIARSIALFHRRPGLGIRSKVKKRLRDNSQVPCLPPWLNSAFADRSKLWARWAQWNTFEPGGEHPLRAEAYGRLVTAPWPWYFESTDPGVTRVPVESRYPFLDLRVVNFLLAIPPLPWCVDKGLLRLAMRGLLPDPVRLRRKTPLAEDPLRVLLKRTGVEWLDRFEATPELAQYVDRRAIPRLTGRCEDTEDPWLHIRPLCLNYWFQARSCSYAS